VPTRVVRFVPAALPEHGKPGDCQASLTAAYRNDAFRCTADNTIYDPCFATGKAGHVLCDVDPRKPSSGTLLLATTSTAPPADTNGARNRAWVFELTDGTLCRPLLDNRRSRRHEPIYSCKWVSWRGRCRTRRARLEHARLDDPAGDAQQESRAADDRV
jgi:hypothetical protein